MLPLLTVWVALATRFLKYLSLQKHILWDGLSLMHCQTLTSNICFTRTEAIMKEGDSRILSIFTTSLPSPV